MSASVCLCFGPRERGPDAPADPELGAAAAEFPTAALAIDCARRSANSLVIDSVRWRAGELNLYELDAQVDQQAQQRRVHLHIVAPEQAFAIGAALEVLTRCQRWLDRRNAGSGDDRFDAVLALHRRVHDLEKPLVCADYRHALDVWQWALRLWPEADTAVQIATLFHDIERLVSEADERIEHRAAGYDAFKRAHARGGAHMTCELLGTLGIEDALRTRVAYLIASHDRPARPDSGTHDPDLALLEDADGLSFFSLNSAGFLDYFGPEHTRRKIEWTLARMSPAARARLRQVRLRPDLAGLVRQADPAVQVAPIRIRTTEHARRSKEALP